MLALVAGLASRAGPSPLGTVGNCRFGSMGSVIGREDVSARKESRGDSSLGGVHSTFVKHAMDALNGGAAIEHMLPLAAALIGAFSFQRPHQADGLACVLGTSTL